MMRGHGLKLGKICPRMEAARLVEHVSLVGSKFKKRETGLVVQWFLFACHMTTLAHVTEIGTTHGFWTLNLLYRSYRSVAFS